MTTQLPAHLQNRRPSGLTHAVSQGLSSGAPPYISIAGNRFTLIDAAGNEKPVQTLHIDLVIVQANPTVSKVYYDKEYDRNAEAAPPVCFSDNGVGPSRQSSKPQSPTCAACPNNVWGSDVSRLTGKPTKACNDVKKIAVVLSDNPEMPFLLRVPPASLKHLGAYARTIAAQSAGTRPVELSDVITRVTFESQGILNFEAVGWIDERTMGAIEKIWDEKRADDLVGLNDTVHLGAPQLSAPGAARAPAGQLPPPPQPAILGNGASQQVGYGYNTPSQPAAIVPSVPQASSAPPAQDTPQVKRGRGRPKKDEAVAPAQQQVPAFMQASQAALAAPPAPEAGGIPAFLRRDQPVAEPAKPQFGMQAAPQPSAELSAAIDRAMNLPLPGTR